MEINAISPIANADQRSAKTFQRASHNFALKVQGAIGPKQLSGYGLEGRVLVAFSLGIDGSLTALRVARSSGHDQLDRAAVDIVSKTSFPSPPPGISTVQRTYVSAFSFS